MPAGELVVRALPAQGNIEFSLVVPTRNESHNLAELIARLTPAIVSEVGDSYEIIVVDDDSPDRTWQVAAAMAARDAHVVALRRTDERGLATAVVRGWQAARGRLLGVIDADLQHPPEVTAELIAAMRGGADLAVASREADGGGVSDWSLMRLLISRASRALGKLLLPGVLELVSDPMTGFFVIRRAAIENLPLAPCGYKILVEVLVRSRVQSIVEVGYVFRSRQRGQSKASLRVFVDYVQHLFRLRDSARARRAGPAPRKLQRKTVAADRVKRPTPGWLHCRLSPGWIVLSNHARAEDVPRQTLLYSLQSQNRRPDLSPTHRVGATNRLCNTEFALLLPGWRNWQTQRTQNPPTARSWGFDSPSRHQGSQPLYKKRSPDKTGRCQVVVAGRRMHPQSRLSQEV